MRDTAAGGLTGGLRYDLRCGGNKLGEILWAICRCVPQPLIPSGPLKTLLVAWAFEAFLCTVGAARLRLIATDLLVIHVSQPQSLHPLPSSTGKASAEGRKEGRVQGRVPATAYRSHTRFATSVCSSYSVALRHHHLPRCRAGRKRMETKESVREGKGRDVCE